MDEVYMTQFDNFIDAKYNNIIFKLERIIYKLKQAFKNCR